MLWFCTIKEMHISFPCVITLLWRRQSQNFLHDPQCHQYWPVECVNAADSCSFHCMPCTASQFTSFFLSPCACFVLSCLAPRSPQPILSLQSMRTLALHWVWRVPGHAAENNLLLPHLPNKHPCLNQHLPHGPLPQRGRRRHPGRDHCRQWRRFLPDGTAAHRRRDVSGKSHRRATGLWPVFGAKVASPWHAQRVPG